MTSSKQIESVLPVRIPRSGHGAASVIPHLNDVVRLESWQLDVADEERAWQAGPQPAAGAGIDSDRG